MPSSHSWLPPALEKPNVRRYALGHGISVLGGWIQATALSWLVYRLTGSVFMLGLMGFLQQIPYLLLGPFTGSIVDRTRKVPLLIGIDIALSVMALALAVMAARDVRVVWPYMVLGLLQGALNALEMPTRQSLLAHIVEERALMPSALGLSASLFNGGRLVGPALAGFALLYVSETWCFVANAVSNIAIIAALLTMHIKPEALSLKPSDTRPGVLSSITALWQFPRVRTLVPLMAAVGMFGVPYLFLLPSIATTFFSGTSSTYGLLLSAAGGGAMSAAIVLSMQRGTSTQRALITIAPIVVGVALVGFAISRAQAISMLLLFAVAASVMCCANAANVLLQQAVPDAWRGRVIGLYGMSFQGVAPVGTLLAGAVASHIGLSTTLLIDGLIVAGAGFLARHHFLKHPEILDQPSQTDPER